MKAIVGYFTISVEDYYSEDFKRKLKDYANIRVQDRAPIRRFQKKIESEQYAECRAACVKAGQYEDFKRKLKGNPSDVNVVVVSFLVNEDFKRKLKDKSGL